ncbi:MAG: rod-binding protein [Treponemataceae bacterium]|nr:rod-binding protein [Treponemataceae bacterium]
MQAISLTSLLYEQPFIGSGKTQVEKKTEVLEDSPFSELLMRAQKESDKDAKKTALSKSGVQGASSSKSLSPAQKGFQSSAVRIDTTSTLYQECQELEAFVLKTVLNGLRRTIMKSELFDTGFAGKMYEDMLYDKYAEELAKNGGFGLAEQAYLELTGQRGKVINKTI